VQVMAKPHLDMTQRQVMMPARPDVGVIGAPMKLSTNRYRTLVKPNLIIYHYDVHVSNITRDDERLKKSLSTDKSDLTSVLLRETLSQILMKVASENGWGHGWAYDGKKSLYSVSPDLSKDRSSHHVTIKEGGVDTTFLVQVTILLYLWPRLHRVLMTLPRPRPAQYSPLYFYRTLSRVRRAVCICVCKTTVISSVVWPNSFLFAYLIWSLTSGRVRRAVCGYLR
jgi:hypothetical protein